MHVLKIVIAGLLSLLTVAFAQEPTPKNPPTGEPVTYKHIDGRDLRLYLHKPANWNTGKPKAAVVLFHGGGWINGSPASFNTQAGRIAADGALAITVQYRLLEKGAKVPPQICVEDAKSAMRWVRSHAKELHIDPNRIAAGGGSAGGYMAAYTAVLTGWDDPQDDLKVSPKPNALVLFNPVIDTGPTGYANNRFGDVAAIRSPLNATLKNWPPTLIQSGSEDKLIHADVLRAFADKMTTAGMKLELRIYPGQVHAFYNKEPYRTQTTEEMEKFLKGLGWFE
ncbi:MAG: alpha/beta hydrolase fold domain-containing protein [Acidobacteria bacterium]|nr:alpha/beta hydrolase fold domain-containing protein [Acidobacteriota bacterium]